MTETSCLKYKMCHSKKGFKSLLSSVFWIVMFFFFVQGIIHRRQVNGEWYFNCNLKAD